MIRYGTVRSARGAGPKPLESLVNYLIPFGIFLADQHPQVTTLAALDRGHIKAFVVANRTRPTPNHPHAIMTAPAMPG